MQEVIDNLMISAIQYRAETDPDIRPHVHQRCVQEIVVQGTREVKYCQSTLLHVLTGVIDNLGKIGVTLSDTSRSHYLYCMLHACLMQDASTTLACNML